MQHRGYNMKNVTCGHILHILPPPLPSPAAKHPLPSPCVPPHSKHELEGPITTTLHNMGHHHLCLVFRHNRCVFDLLQPSLTLKCETEGFAHPLPLLHLAFDAREGFLTSHNRSSCRNARQTVCLSTTPLSILHFNVRE